MMTRSADQEIGMIEKAIIRIVYSTKTKRPDKIEPFNFLRRSQTNSIEKRKIMTVKIQASTQKGYHPKE